VYFVVAPTGACAGDTGAACACDDDAGVDALGLRVNVIGCGVAPIPFGPRASTPDGSAANVSRQPGEQK
jgi:hypothetical protein